jgi:hypothetical protein
VKRYLHTRIGRRCAAILLCIGTMLGGSVVVAGAAAATITVNGGCSIGGYSFNGYATLNGGVLNSYTVKFSGAPYHDLEWRVRTFNLVSGYTWDSGYNIGPGLNNITVHPNAPVGSPVNVTFNIGKYGDGYPTCQFEVDSVYN